jgi:hypothetical protein
MSSFSEIVGPRRASQDSKFDRTDFLVRKGKPPTSLAAALRTHEEEDVTEDSSVAVRDALIQGLIDRLPSPDSVWSPSERATWLRTAESVFDLVYKVGEPDRVASRLPSTSKAPVELLSGSERKKVQAVASQDENA